MKELTQDDQEIRVWKEFGIGYFNPCRIVKSKNKVTGELILFWNATPEEDPPGESFHDLMLYSLKRSCDQFKVGAKMGTCRAILKTESRWSKILSQVECANIWNLPDQSILPDGGMFTDGYK